MSKKISKLLISATLALSVGNFATIKAGTGPLPIAIMDGVKYATLQEAIEKSTDGSVITILRDSYEKIASGTDFNTGKRITLDLNDHIVEVTNHKDNGNIVVSNGTELTLVDSGTKGTIISNSPYVQSTCASGIIEVSGEDSELIVNDGTIKAVIEEDPTNKGQFGVTASQGGDITINGGTIEAGWYAISGNGNNKTQNSIFTVNGGTLISTADYAIYNPQAGGTVINGGTVYGAAGAISLNAGTLTVTDGVITSKGVGDTGDWGDGTGNQANSAIYLGAKYADVTATITGGKITAENEAAIIIKDSKNNVNLTVTGGLYSSDVTQWVAKDYKVVKAIDGKFKVVPKTTSISLAINELKLELGKTYTLKATLNPEGAVDDITYTSSNPGVASVDAKGIITSKASGTTTITATANGKTATCEVTVYKVAKPSIPSTGTGNDSVEVVLDQEAGSVLQDSVKKVLEDLENTNTTVVSNETKKKLQEAIELGKEINVKPTVEAIDKSSVAPETIAKIEKELGEKENVAQYFSMSMLLTADGKSLGTLNELTGKVKFTITLDKKLIKDGRKFYMVRIHGDGKAEKISGVLDGNKFTFETDKFSTFAIVEDDSTVQEKPVDPVTPVEPEKPEVTKPSKNDKVETGDQSTMGIYLALLGVSLLGFGVVVTRKHSAKKSNK